MNTYTYMDLKIKFCMKGKNMKLMIKYMSFNLQIYFSSSFVTLMPHVQIHNSLSNASIKLIFESTISSTM